MLKDTDLVSRLDAVERRLDDLAAAEPHGLTEPDPGGTERWEAGQVWGHMAELVPYWLREIQTLVVKYEGAPVPFGRTKEDPGRLAGVEMGRHEAVRQLRGSLRDSIAELERYLATLTSTDWQSVGLHGVRGEMGVEAIVGRFIVAHLEEHADQLDGLTTSS